MLAGLNITLGPATDSRATVYFYPRLAPGVDPAEGWRLAGVVRGPRCLYARTLPADATIADLGVDPRPLARAEVFEPCYWTPDLPYLYEIELRLLDGDRELDGMTATVGLKRFAIDRGRLWLDGSPHVLRAWNAPHTDADVPWTDLRGHRVSLWRDEPTDTLLAQAAKHGVPVATPQANVGDQSAVLPLGDARVCFTDAPVNACLLGGAQAVVVRRPDRSVADASAARAACERLQRDCAPFTDLAGYVV
ncbi:MAG: hypothetical protein AAFV43_16210 [Planctomycetota bacterium]